MNPCSRCGIGRQWHTGVNIPLECGKDSDHVSVFFCIGFRPSQQVEWAHSAVEGTDQCQKLEFGDTDHRACHMEFVGQGLSAIPVFGDLLSGLKQGELHLLRSEREEGENELAAPSVKIESGDLIQQDII